MPFTDPFAAAPQATQPPPPAGTGFVDPFAQPAPPRPDRMGSDQKPVPAPGGAPGIFRSVLSTAGKGVHDILRSLRVPQQATATALADFIVTNHRMPSVSEWLQSASQAVHSDESFDDVMRKAGVSDTLGRHIAGMIADVVLDPLWIVTPAKVAKLAGIPRMIEAAKATKPAQALVASPVFRGGMRALVDPLFGLPQKYINSRTAAQVGISKGWQSGIDLGQRIQRELTPEEQRYVTRYMELGGPWQYGEAALGKPITEHPDQVILLNEARAAGLNADKIQAIGREVKTADLNQLRDLVDRGVIPKKMVDPFWDLPGEQILGIGPDQVRQKALNEFFTKNPQEYAKRAAQFSRQGLPLPSAHIRREYRFWEDPEGFIKSMRTKNPEQAARLEAWWRTRSGMSNFGSYRPMALNFGFLVTRDPGITDIIREAMGEIREAAHPIATSQIEGRRFIELYDFLKRTADQFAIPNERATEAIQKGYKFIENKPIWGALAGKWLPTDIADDILRTVGKDNHGLALLLRKFRVGVGWWKYGKIVLSPSAHVRIMLHNLLLWDWSGAGGIMKSHRLAQSLRALAQGAKNPLYKEMMDSGVVLHNTYAENVLDEMLANDPMVRSGTGWSDVAKNLELGSKNIFRTFIGRPAEALLAFEERLFKAATFAEYRAQGKSLEEAAKMTNDALLNYKRLPNFWNMVRGYGIVPFVAFPLQATSRAARAISLRPAVVGKYGKIFRDIETGRSGMTPSQIKAEESVLPPEMDQGAGWLRLGKMPDGKIRYLNLGYTMPLWIVPESFRALQQSLPGGNPENRAWTSAALGGFLNISGYPLMKAMVEQTDPFTGKKFKDTHDLLMYLYNYASPPLTGVYAQQMWAALHGRPVDPTSKGTPKRPKDVLARAFAAWSTRDFDPHMEQVWRLREMQQEILVIDKEMKRIASAPYLSEDERNRLLSEQMDKIRHVVDQLSRVGGIQVPDEKTGPASDLFPTPQTVPPSRGFQNPWATP